MRFTTFLIAVTASLIFPTHGFIAWSGDACDGDQGATAACDGSCGDFAGRHSFEVLKPLLGRIE